MMTQGQTLHTILRRVGFLTLITVLAFGGFSSAQAESRSGHTDWGSWSFDWEVKGNTGLALRNVAFNGELLLHKASMPVIRVKYTDDWPRWHPYSWWPLSKLQFTRRGGKCGPFQDRLSWGRFIKRAECAGSKICQESFVSNGVQWLEVGAFGEIGEYDLYQAWYLSQDGQLDVTVQSGGLSCQTDHDHHAYWRFDFAVKDKDHDQVFVFDPSAPDSGWGSGWTKYTQELDTVKNQQGTNMWFVRDHLTGHGVWIIPGQHDGIADGFSDRDVSPRLFKVSEDESWMFGARGDLAYNEAEDIQETDIVFWYVGHLPHKVSDTAFPPDAFVGPTLRVQR